MLLSHALRAVQKTSAMQRLYTWGSNVWGTLGNSDAAINIGPVQVGTLSNWSQVAKRYTHTLAVKTDGTLWAWGRNNSGQLGANDLIDRSSPIQIGSDTNWSSVSAGSEFSLAIKTNGTLWAWGLATNGRTGLSTTSVNYSSPVQVGTLSNWTQVSAASDHVVGVAGGTMYTWGSGSFGKLGNNSQVSASAPSSRGSGWRMASAGLNHCLAVKSGSTSALWTWGNGSDGQLGLNNLIPYRSSPVQVGNTLNYIEISAGSQNNQVAVDPADTLVPGGLYTWGNLNRTAVTLVSGTSGYTYVNSGLSVMFSRKTDGTVWAWGSNNFGNAGNGQVGGIGSSIGLNVSLVPQLSNMSVIASGFYTGTPNYGSNSLGIDTTGKLYAWGYDYFGELGLNKVGTPIVNTPTLVGPETTNWAAVYGDIAGSFVVGLKTDGTLWSWGNNASGQLGINSLLFTSSPVQIGSDTDWTDKISAGGGSVAAIKSNNTLWTWGINTYGKLGLNTNQPRSSPTQVGTVSNYAQVSMSADNMIFVRTTGTIWGTGSSQNGSLAFYSATLYFSSPLQIGALSNWRNVSTDAGTVLATKTDNTLWAWGANLNGQVGNNTIVNRSSPVQIAAGTTYSNVYAGASFSFGKLTNGGITAWGSNSNGRLGTNNTISRSTPIQIGTLSNWSQVAPGTDYAIALKTDGTIWGWGTNTSGQLGLGNLVNVSSPVQIGSATTWIEVSGGDNTGRLGAGVLSE